MTYPEPVRNKKAATSESAFSLLLQHKATIVNGVLLAIGSTVATYISLFYYGTGRRSIWRCLNIILMQRCYWRALLRLWVRCWWGCYVIRLGVKLILISRVMVLLCSWPSFWLLVNYPSRHVADGGFRDGQLYHAWRCASDVVDL